MASEWQEVSIGSLSDGIFDGPHATPVRTDAGPIFLGISSLINGRLDLSQSDHLSEEDFPRWTKRVIPKKDDLVFSYETRLGEAALIPDGLRCCLGRRMALLRLNQKKADPRFLLYAFLSPQFQDVIRSRTKQGSTVQRILLTEFGEFPIVVPTLHEQQRVGAALATLDARIDLLTETSKTCEAIARAIFKSWFVDFDPVLAKAEGREPEGMDAAIAALFPSEVVESGKGIVPVGWSIHRLSDFVDINPLRSLSKAKPAPYLGMANAATTGPRPVAWVDRLPISGCRFRNGDTLLAKITPCLENGKTAFVDFLSDDQIGWGSTEFVVLAPKRPIPPVFGYLLARDRDFRAFAIQSMSGTSGRQRIQVDQLGKYEFAIADAGVYGAFAGIVEPMFAAISHNDNQAKALAELRDTLLPRLISGKLRVPEAEKLVEAVL